VITAGNYANLPAKNFDFLPLNENRYPSKIDFELSNECNLECIMCRGEFSSAIRRNREKLPPIESVYDSAFVDQLEAFIPHLENSHFLGGEPFMIPIYLDIWERMVQINPKVRISVQTNGTILTDRIKRILDSMRFEIAVSIDSIEEENYRIIRKNGELNKVLENIHYFRNYCRERGTNFHISYCPMVQNWEELPRVVEFANKLDCHVFFNTVYNPKSCSIATLSANEISKVIEQLSQAQLPDNSNIERENLRGYQNVIKQFQHWEKEARKREDLNRETGKSDSFESYLVGLNTYISKETDLSYEEQLTLSTDIETKLGYILEVAETHGRLEDATQHLLDLDYKTIVASLPKMDREHTLYLFKTFIMPLPD
jgi:MoaA/NifB/PqqE/SkfB family radical SAM enzyme